MRVRHRTPEIARPFSLDHLVGAGDERCRHLDAERFRGLQIDDQLELRWLIVGYIARAGASQDLCNLAGDVAVGFENVERIGHEPAEFANFAKWENLR